MAEGINTADEAIDAAGGSTAVARFFDVDVRVVSNWRKRGLPPDTFAGFRELLSAKGFDVPPSLWRQREVHRA